MQAAKFLGVMIIPLFVIERRASVTSPDFFSKGVAWVRKHGSVVGLLASYVLVGIVLAV